MSSDPSYISSIPPHAREEDITGKPGSVRRKVTKNYHLGRSFVGQRVYSQDGVLLHERSYKNGKRHGWWYDWYGDGRLSSVIPYDNGREHGIEREWGIRGGLCRGFPKYWIDGKQVDKRAYARAGAADPTLRPFCIEDDRPYRVFPPEVGIHLPQASTAQRERT